MVERLFIFFEGIAGDGGGGGLGRGGSGSLCAK